MKKERDRYFSIITQFEKLLELKNRQLEALKDIALILAEMEDEKAFVKKFFLS